jgi:Leu/Phe-tRNA-protein transferase
MPDMILAKNGQRFSHLEWITLDSNEKDMLLSRYGPAYTIEAWKKNHVVDTKPRKKFIKHR